MMKIYKYQLKDGFTALGIHQGAKILTAQLQNGEVCLWAEVNPNAEVELRKFRIIGTGHDLPDGLNYIATVQDYIFVWHVYEERS